MNPWNMKIVADSSCDIFSLESVPFASAPLRIITDEKEYVDDQHLDVAQMVDDLLSYSGKSGTACPGTGDWLDAFGDASYVFCVTITSNLSGSFNSARVAKQEYAGVLKESGEQRPCEQAGGQRRRNPRHPHGRKGQRTGNSGTVE